MSEPVSREEFAVFAEAVLYELRLANWIAAGGPKYGLKPVPPGYQAVSVDGKRHIVREKVMVGDMETTALKSL